MSKRTFPYIFSINANNSANPLVYTTTANNITASYPAATSFTVANNAPFQVRDKIVLDPGNTNQEVVEILGFPAASTIIAVCQKSHNNAVYVALKAQMASLYVQSVPGGANNVFFGNNKSMSNNSYLIAMLTKTAAGIQPYDWTDNEQGSGINPLSTDEYWVYGTAGDLYNVVLTRI